MALAAFVILVTVAGAGLSEALWRRLETVPSPLVRLTSAALLAFLVAVGIGWGLALPLLLDRTALSGSAALAGLAGLLLLGPSLRSSAQDVLPAPSRGAFAVLGLLTPVAAWLAFALWKGAVLPVANDDALIYHMPKATLLLKWHGFLSLAASDDRIASYPWNFELLLSEGMILGGGDRVVEWLSTLTWALFVVAGAALAEELWGRGRHVLAVALVCAGAPVGLLQSASVKNDLLAAFLGVAALLFLVRFSKRPALLPWSLCLAALALGIGTKVPFGTVAGGVGIVGGYVAVKAMKAGAIGPRRFLALSGGIALLSTVFLGGVPYLENLRRSGRLLGPNPTGSLPSLVGLERLRPEYLWEFPILLLTVPFSPDSLRVPVPWNGERWFWMRDYSGQSHYGAVFTMLVIAAPLVWWRRRRIVRDATPGLRPLLAAAAIGFALPAFLPQGQAGLYSFVPRYVLFVVPVVATAVVSPLFDFLEKSSGRRAVVWVLGGMGLAFCLGAAEAAIHDSFAPMSYVRAHLLDPSSRRTFLFPFRAALVLDELAGPRDAVAIDAGHDTWLYPVFGRDFGREVVYLPPGEKAVTIPGRVSWVVVDRATTMLRGAPGFVHYGHALDYFWKGLPTDEELRVLRAVMRDPRFRLVFHDPAHNQAVFARSGPVAEAALELARRIGIPAPSPEPARPGPASQR